MNAARQTPFKAPVVERLAVRVVVDSHYERFLPPAEHDHVAIEHVGGIPGRPMSTLAGEWGLALHLESRADGAKAEYMLDFGYTSEILNRNVFDKAFAYQYTITGPWSQPSVEFVKTRSRDGDVQN